MRVWDRGTVGLWDCGTMELWDCGMWTVIVDHGTVDCGTVDCEVLLGPLFEVRVTPSFEKTIYSFLVQEWGGSFLGGWKGPFAFESSQ